MFLKHKASFARARTRMVTRGGRGACVSETQASLGLRTDVDEVAVRVDERAHALAPRLVGRREDLLGAGGAEIGRGGIDVVGVDPERDVARLAVGTPAEADAVRLQGEEDELEPCSSSLR